MYRGDNCIFVFDECMPPVFRCHIQKQLMILIRALTNKQNFTNGKSKNFDEEQIKRFKISEEKVESESKDIKLNQSKAFLYIKCNGR